MTPRRLFYILMTIVTLLILAGGGLYYLSHIRLSEKINLSNRLAADILLENERLEQLTSLQNQYDELGELSNKTERVLPAEKLQSEVTAQLFVLIDQARLSSSGISYEPTSGSPSNLSQTAAAQTSGVLVMPANFQVSGSYNQLLSLLHNIERHERMMQVNSLDISRLSEGDLSFNIRVEVFLKP